MAGQRDVWEIKLVSSIEELSIAVKAEPVNKRVIIRKINNVESTFENLERAHCQYCQKAKIGVGSTDSREYLRGQV